METTTIIIIVGVLMFINLLWNNKRINALREQSAKLKSSIQSVKDTTRNEFDEVGEGITSTRQVFSSLLGLKSIEMKSDKSHIIAETADDELLFMDLCKMNKQFVPLQKVGKTIPSKNLRVEYKGVEYHYTPVVDECDCEF